MRLLHLADLHLGRDFFRFSLREEQRAVLEQILSVADETRPDALLIAGDLFDRSPAPQEALALYDDFITQLIRRGIQVFAISGNHDSPVRLGVGSRLMAGAGYYLEAEPRKELVSRILETGGERLRIFQMPYLRKSRLRSFCPDSENCDFTACMERYLQENLPGEKEESWLLLAHQWVTGQGEKSGTSASESDFIGAVEPLPLRIFERFDYLALGHLHRPQSLAARGAYAGSPLFYSASELATPKSVPLLDFHDGQFQVRLLPLKMPRGLRVLRGSLDELLELEAGEDFVIAELLDRTYPQEALQRLRGRFPFLCQIHFCREEAALHQDEHDTARQQQLSPLDLFSEFFQEACGHPLSASQETLCRDLFSHIGEDRR